MTDGGALKLLHASPAERLKLVRSGEHEAELRADLGDAAYTEYRALAERVDDQHLAVEAPRKIVLVPGVMGSLLQSTTKGGVWWIDVRARDYIDKLRLSPTGNEDANAEDRIEPFNVDLTYVPFQSAVIARNDFGVAHFAYDWRKHLRLAADDLHDYIIGVHERSGEDVHLVGHSMGGLVIRLALHKHHELWQRIGKIVFVGTPHYGSPAIAGYLKNHLWGFDLMALLGFFLSRETFRSLWGVIGLLPAPRGVYPGTRPGDTDPWTSSGDPYEHPCANFDLYDAESWRLGLAPPNTQQLQAVLDAAAQLHRELAAAHAALDQTLRDRMLMIAGVGIKTLFRLEYDSAFWGLWEHTSKVTSRIEGDRHREGDGRVPLASAQLENVEARYVRGVHGGLTNIPAVYEDIFRWLNDKPLRLPDSIEGALSSHLALDEESSEAPHLDLTAAMPPFGQDDAGLWAVDHLDPAVAAGLEQRLDGGDFPEFARLHLL